MTAAMRREEGVVERDGEVEAMTKGELAALAAIEVSFPRSFPIDRLAILISSCVLFFVYYTFSMVFKLISNNHT